MNYLSADRAIITTSGLSPEPQPEGERTESRGEGSIKKEASQSELFVARAGNCTSYELNN